MWEILLPSFVLVFFSDMDMMMSVLMVIMLITVPYLSSFHSYKVYFHSYLFCLDKMSSFLMVLTLWMMMLMCLSMYKAPNLGNLLLCFTSLKLMLIVCFMSSTLLGFYMFFEISLIPTLMIILGWGIQPERIRAGTYLMLYTLVGSLPLLGCILFMDYHCGTVKIYSPMMEMYFFSGSDYSMMCLLWMLAFLMKLPMYGVHLWLPKAHVEAPVAGSMMLAGVLLKLGAYGLLRSLRFLSLDLCFWSDLFFMWSLFSMCLVGLMCFRQCDLKSLMAYSSVAHMSLMFAACFSCDVMGIKGILSMLVSHGLCSSGLFFGVQCLYESSGSRSLYLNRGWISLSPFFCFFWFLLCVGKASAPPSLNLLSEFFLISSMVKYGGYISGMFCGLAVFLGGLFSIYLYVLVCHGKWSIMKKYWMPLTFRHYLILFLHVVPLYGLLFFSKYLFFP